MLTNIWLYTNGTSIVTSWDRRGLLLLLKFGQKIISPQVEVLQLWCIQLNALARAIQVHFGLWVRLLQMCCAVKGPLLDRNVD
jgi:hypothetical protein